MANLDRLLSYISQEIPPLAHDLLGGYAQQATKDIQRFIKTLEVDLKSWTELYAQGRITSSDFEFLIKGKGDLVKMRALKQAGLAKVALEKFRDAALGIIIRGIQSAL